MHVDHHNIMTIPIDESTNEFHILNANDGGLAYSRDGGETWKEGDVAFLGYNTGQFYDATKRPGSAIYFGSTQATGLGVPIMTPTIAVNGESFSVGTGLMYSGNAVVRTAAIP